MRLAGQAKCGFYPAHPKAIQMIATHLKLHPLNPEKQHMKINLLDPCAGEGVAVHDLSVLLGIPQERVYTVELDGGRSAKIKELMPDSQHVGPAGFAGVQITGCSFSLIYLNPPFDMELGGGNREEFIFTKIATTKLVPKGILVLVCPFKALCGNKDFCELIDANYEDVCVYKFPDGADDEGNLIRPYNEIVVIGKKRGSAIPTAQCEKFGKLHLMMMQWGGYVELKGLPEIGKRQPKYWSRGVGAYEPEDAIRLWEVPLSQKPNTFKKIAYTDIELEALLDASPLNGVLKEVIIPGPAEPPLPLDKGHLGLILASGMLDGIVEGPHGVHVVRGSSHKVEYHNKEASTNEMNPESGAVTTKDVFSQRPVTVIRTVEQDGKINTYSNEPTEEGHSDPECDL